MTRYTTPHTQRELAALAAETNQKCAVEVGSLQKTHETPAAQPAQRVNGWDAHAEFVAGASDARKAFDHVCGDLTGHKTTVGKHEARNHEHLRRIYGEAKDAFPRFADTLAWLLWWNIKNADRLAFLTGPDALEPAAQDGAEVERLTAERDAARDEARRMDLARNQFLGERNMLAEAMRDIQRGDMTNMMELTEAEAARARATWALRKIGEPVGDFRAERDALKAGVERLNDDREAADQSLVDRYRNPKTGQFSFPRDVAAIVRALDHAEAERDALKADVERKDAEIARLRGILKDAANYPGGIGDFARAALRAEQEVEAGR